MSSSGRRIAAGTEAVGARDYQEDAHLIVPLQPASDGGARYLCLLADGMGGHVGGAVASSTAIEAFLLSFEESAHARSKDRMRAALDAANAALAAKVVSDPSLDGMGCTFVGVYLKSGRITWISVGDSPLWRFHRGELERLNADHSVFGSLMAKVEAGKITREEAASHPKRNALRSALMGRDISLIDVGKIKLRSGDRVLIASDGLETLSEDEICAVMVDANRQAPSTVVDTLVKATLAVQAPRQDNISVIVLDSIAASAARTKAPAAKSAAENAPAATPSQKLPWMAACTGLAVGVLIGAAVTLAIIGGSDTAPTRAVGDARSTISPEQSGRSAQSGQTGDAAQADAPEASAAETAPTTTDPAKTEPVAPAENEARIGDAIGNANEADASIDILPDPVTEAESGPAPSRATEEPARPQQ